MEGAGVVIGRFQVADLTSGHSQLLHRVARNHDKLVVLLGVHPKLSTRENPLSYEARENMLREHFADTIGKNTNKKLLIAPLPNRATDETWSKQVDNLLASLLGPKVKKTLYGGRDSFVSRYHGRCPIGNLVFDDEEEFLIPGSATEQREDLFDKPPMTEEGRAGAIWAMGHQWNRLDPCVDMAVIHGIEGKCQVLMGRKYGGTGLYCFPGGHIDPTDDSAEFAASRELVEETGVVVEPADWRYVCQVPINDWRNVPSQRTWSTLFVSEYERALGGEIKAGDDLDVVEWVDLSEDIAKVSPSHHELFRRLRDLYNVHITRDIESFVKALKGDENDG
jgi:8-oxo-dGTP pyrophosphatase MutT (NUDIX family)